MYSVGIKYTKQKKVWNVVTQKHQFLVCSVLSKMMLIGLKLCSNQTTFRFNIMQRNIHNIFFDRLLMVL